MAKCLVKCLYCGQTFDRNNPDEKAVKINRRYAHGACAEQHEATMTQEERDTEAFYECVKNIFGKGYDYLKTKRLAEKYIKDYNYTYSGMTKALIWFYQIQKNDTSKSNSTIGILPYIYQQAYDYYYAIYLAQQQNVNVNTYSPAVKEITIPTPTVWERSNKSWFQDEDDE